MDIQTCYTRPDLQLAELNSPQAEAAYRILRPATRLVNRINTPKKVTCPVGFSALPIHEKSDLLSLLLLLQLKQKSFRFHIELGIVGVLTSWSVKVQHEES